MGLLEHVPHFTDLQRYIMEQDWEAAKTRLKYHPKEARQWIKMTLDNGEKTEALPLHLAVRGYAPIDFVKSLIDAYPKAAHKPDLAFGRMPLHYACLHTPYPELIELLLEHSKEAAAVKDREGRTALHFAAFGHAHEYIFKLLLDAHRQSAEVKDEKGWLPLHVAVRYNCSHGVIDCLVRAYPGGLKEKTEKGNQLPKDLVKKYEIDVDERTNEILNASFTQMRRQSSKLSEYVTPELLEIDASTG